MVNFFYYLIIAVVVAEYLINTTMTLLNIKASKWPIPSSLADIYNQDSYRRQQEYSMSRRKFGMLSSAVSTVVTLALFALGGFALFDRAASSLTQSPVLQAIIFWAIFSVATWIINLPFSAWSTFVIESRFGFNRTSKATFVADVFKSLAMDLVITSILLGACAWIYQLTQEYFWIIAWGVLTLFSLFIQYFYSQLIVPLFNKQTPLEEGQLREAIESFAAKVGFKLKDIYVMDSSKRSTHANAYFTGFGARKRIVLYDTLIQQLSSEEIVAVLAHEIGHYRHRHILKSMIYSWISSLVMLYVFNLFIGSQSLAACAGAQHASFHLNLAIFSLIYTPVTMVLDFLTNLSSRRSERQADEFARKNGQGEMLISALKKMSAKSLSNLTPHPIVVFLEFSHPTLEQRVEALSKN